MGVTLTFARSSGTAGRTALAYGAGFQGWVTSTQGPALATHSARVRRFAVAVAGQLGLAEEVVQEIGLAAELHDVGKVAVPRALLDKAGPLSADEHRRVLEHTVIGERMLAPLLGDHPVVLAAVRSHHEWVDGSGYPDGLVGERIPLVARIVAVADAFDAMTSMRPYRAALSTRMAVREVVRCAGTQFDQRCMRALLAVVRNAASASGRGDGSRRSGGVAGVRPWWDSRWKNEGSIPRTAQ